ncbi:MAG: tetratricopeptide repeat protein [Gemmatimonadetes bacterium]|nr:tetratricopeptide repeat protein [Gemmatimonadota bacterium]NNM04534.1 tetratricopeptide repeat protein [Gemmatimonadota bacterium]
MNGRLRLGLLALVSACLAAIPLHPQEASAQEATARFRVMVPEIQPLNGADKKFGERLADQLRDLINDMLTHQPIEERELKRALNEYDVDMEDLDCIRAKQLAGLINAQVVFCGNYAPDGANFRVETKFIDSSGEEFPVDPVTVPERGQREAAEHIYQALQLQSDQARFAQFCGDYASSQQWQDAEAQCSQAIELNPAAVNSRYTLGVVYRETERPEEALAEFVQVLEIDPLHEEAMQFAGYLSALLGRDEDARSYYQQYLQLNPANANVRMRVAYELAQAGDALGAMQFIEEGLAVDGENVDLLKQHGGFAFTAGAELNQGQEEMPQEAVELFRKALTSFDQVYAIEAEEMDVALLRNMVAAHINLEEAGEAVALAERILETHGDESTIWAIYADALRADENLDEAIVALDRVMELDPEYPNVAARKGSWLLQEGRVDEAIPTLQGAVERGEQSADAVADLVFANAVNEGVQKQDWPHAISTLRLAKGFEVTDLTSQKLDFWLGYAIFQSARRQQEPQTLETARATLPRFQEVLRLMRACGDYAQRNNRESNRQELLTATNTFIEIQDAIIRRGR